MGSSATASKELISRAVHNSSILSRKGLLDRLFSAWFNRLVYPQIWEDPEVDIQALELDPQSRIFTISSGGCNVFNYLTESPTSITVVDLNEAHIALIKLKKIAIERLDYEAFFDFFGRANLNKNLDVYRAYIRPHLDEATRNYWEKRSGLLRKPRYHYFAKGFYRHGLLGDFIGLIHWVGRRLGYDISQMMTARDINEQAKLFEQHVAPLFNTRLVRFLANRPVVLYSLGIPPAQFEEMKRHAKDEQQAMPDLLKERARKLACDFPLADNYFAWQAFGREYDTKWRQALPRYLKKWHFAAIKAQLSQVHVHHKSMTEQLKTMPANSLNAYVLLDAQDWMDESQLNELWTEINRTAMPNARVVFRTAGETSPLEQKLTAENLTPWHTNQQDNQAWTEQDRSAIYGRVHLYYKSQG
jgi:S-adenosylmethionine-diacylglycerol 3-amino-3-carboxypropyl transferase